MKKVRTLRVGELTYLWHVHCRHTRSPCARSEFAEVFSAYLEGARGSPVRILFPRSDQRGGPFSIDERGVVCDHRPPMWCLNLNRPKAARFLIDVARLQGWSPSTVRKEFVLANGYEVLRTQRAVLDAYLASEDGAAPSVDAGR